MLLLATMAFGQAKEDAGDGKMLDKQTMEFKDICRRFTEQSGESTNTRQKQVKAVLKYVMHASVFREMCIR